MKKLIFTILIIHSTFSFYHPGSTSFLEVGMLRNTSVFGYKVQTVYAVPKVIIGDFTLEAFRLNFDLFKTEPIKIGPVLNYSFTPYAGNEISHIDGMSRSGFLETGVLINLALPFGEALLQATRANHSDAGYILKSSFASGIPLLKINENFVWLNFLLEYSILSQRTANYFFGVRESEETSERASFNMSSISIRTAVIGLWTPIYQRWWINFTYKGDHFENKILASPVIRRNYEQTLMLGVMYDF